MPVTFLRTPADYFGIQEAPAQPLFQQTRALADPAVQNQLGFMDKVTQLRQQRPLARAQAMQNEYDTIFANADRLRMQQEAAKQAEQAVGALVGIDGEQPDYLEKKRSIQSQFPMAALDQRVQSLFNDNDRIYTARQSAEARQQQELQQRRARLFGAGATPQQVESAYQNPDAAAQLEYQLGKGGGGDKGNSAALKSAIDLLNDEIKAMSDAGEDYEVVGDQQVMNPAYKELLDRRSKYRDAYLSEVDTSVFPQAKKTVPTAAAPPQAEPQVGFKERMKGLAGGQAAIPQVKDEEVIADLNSPDADENTFIAATTSPSTSLEVKKQALEKLRQFAKEPKFPAGTTVMQAKERLGAINDKIAEAERAVRMEPERQKLNQAWTQEKSQMATYIKDFAKSLGLEPDLVENSLAINELTDPNPEYPVTIRAEFDAFLRNKKGVKGNFLDMQADKLLPFTGSEFAGDFGMEGVIPGFRRFGKGKTYGDVLDAYLAEKVPTSATSPQNQVAQPAPTVKIKSVTPLP